MFKTFGKIAFAFMCGLILSAVLLLVWLSEYIDSKEFRNDFTSALSSAVGREVVLNGELDIAFYPWLGLRAYDLSVANEPGFARESFVHMQDVSVGVRLIPLFSRKLVIRTVLVDGMHVYLMRSKDSRVNWDDFNFDYKSETESLSWFSSIFIHGVEIENAELHFNDAVTGENLTLKGLSAHLGAFAPGDSVGVTLEGVFRRQHENFKVHAALSGLLHTDFSTPGKLFEKTVLEFDATGGKLPSGKPLKGVATIAYNANDGTLWLKDFHVRMATVDMAGQITVHHLLEDFNATGSIHVEPFDPVPVLRSFGLTRSLKSLGEIGAVHGEIAMNADKDGVSLHIQKSTLDTLSLSGVVALHDFNRPRYSFDLVAPHVDLDRYLPLFRTGTPFVWGDFSLPFWKTLNARGKLAIQRFSAVDTVFSDVAATLDASDGTVHAEAKTTVYDGRLHAKMDAVISGKSTAPDMTLAVSAQGMSMRSNAMPFARGEWGEVESTANAEMRFSMNHATCSPDSESADALRQSRLQYTVYSPSVLLHLHKSGLKRHFREFSAKGALVGSKGNAPGFTFETTGHFLALGKRDAQQLKASLQGPLIVDKDFQTVRSSGVRTDFADSGFELPAAAVPAATSAMISWDKDLHTVRLADVAVSAYGSSATGSIVVTKPFDELVHCKGKVVVAKTDLKRILEDSGIDVYRMADDSALRALSLQGAFSIENKALSFGDVKIDVDGTPVSGKLSMTLASHPRFDFDLKAGKIDLDRYLPPDRKADIKKLRAGIDEDAPPVDLPLETLRWLNLHGPVSIEEFVLEDVRLSNLSAVVSAERGVISVSSAKSDFYGGTADGEWTGKVFEKHLETAVDLKLKSFEAGPMLKDVAGRDYVRGVTDADILLRSTGRTDDDIVANLDGSIDLKIGKGSFKFTNWGEKKPPATEKQAEAIRRRTAFRSATSEWTISKGYFHLDDLDVDSSIMHCSGSGGFSPSEETIDLSVKADFVAVPSVTVHIVGHIEDPEVKMPGGKIVTDTIKNIFGLPQRSFRFLRDLFF
ncbi:AsmA family protein [Pseudodesulfovibrio senegalensis]|uniref:AsmA family protein n=1 Tax=Pseudodesulfovibrio senegalensis TaxID=1721087 RepID=A0A6N6N7L0_9BACT|nr:AsmA family protein [Pseudodesulfovibrio senegalensis]KAB1443691.1 AsmA family protein [Pseudodesulfovibrio senegalensis]